MGEFDHPHYLVDRHERLFRFGAAGSSDQFSTGKPVMPARVARGVWSGFRGAVSFVRGLSSLSRGKDWIFNHTGRVRRGADGYRSFYLDELIGHLPSAVIWDEEDVSYHLPAGTRATVRYRILLALAEALSRLSFRPHRIRFQVAGVLMRVLIRVYRPSRIYVLVGYGKEWIIAAAHAEGVSVVELQHGVVYAEHPSYRIPEGMLGSPAAVLLPDECWVYGQFWKEQFEKAGWPAGRVRICGYFPSYQAMRGRPVAEPYIFYSSQPGFQSLVVDHIRSIRDEASKRGFKILIALHPSTVERRELYEPLLDECVQILPEYDSYDLLAHCWAHVSVSSTLLVESAALGLISHTISGPLHRFSHFDKLISGGLLRELGPGQFPSDGRVGRVAELEYLFAPVQIPAR